MSVPVTEVSRGQDLIRVVVTPRRDYYIPISTTMQPSTSEAAEDDGSTRVILATPTSDFYIPVLSSVGIKSIQETCKLATAELVVPRTLRHLNI